MRSTGRVAVGGSKNESVSLLARQGKKSLGALVGRGSCPYSCDTGAGAQQQNGFGRHCQAPGPG